MTFAEREKKLLSDIEELKRQALVREDVISRLSPRGARDSTQEEFLATNKELLRLARHLVALLEDPHPGLFTWHEALQHCREAIWTYESPKGETHECERE